jgi:hypothetical protein
MWSARYDQDEYVVYSLLLDLAIAVILESESNETNNNILLSRILDSPDLKG